MRIQLIAAGYQEYARRLTNWLADVRNQAEFACSLSPLTLPMDPHAYSPLRPCIVAEGL